MGARNLDRIAFFEWAARAPDIGVMHREGWRVMASCETCQLQWRVDLALIIRMRGPRFSLWGKRSACRNMRCSCGVMTFYGLPPRGVLWGELAGRYAKKAGDDARRS